MAKIRVYELATKMGLDNKDVVEKLQQAGVEVTNHISALAEDVGQKFEAEMAGKDVDAPRLDEGVEVKVNEERISSGLIRRRRKTVVKEEPVAEITEAAADAPVEKGVTDEVAKEPEAAQTAEAAAPEVAAEVAETVPAEAQAVEAEVVGAAHRAHRVGDEDHATGDRTGADGEADHLVGDMDAVADDAGIGR